MVLIEVKVDSTTLVVLMGVAQPVMSLFSRVVVRRALRALAWPLAPMRRDPHRTFFELRGLQRCGIVCCWRIGGASVGLWLMRL